MTTTASPANENGTPTHGIIAVDLNGDFSSSAGVEAESKGSHRFIRVNGRTGYQPLSLKSELRLPTDQHTKNEGSFVLWVSPRESLTVSPVVPHTEAKDPNWQQYGLLADVPRTNDIDESIFAWYWRSYWHPQMVAKFMKGKAGNAAADYSVTPYVPVEHLPLRENEWYQFVFTWNKAQSRFCVYVNGILSGKTLYPFHAQRPHPELYLGNTAMVFSGFEAHDVELDAQSVTSSFTEAGFSADHVQAELLSLFTVQRAPAVEWVPGADWSISDHNPLTRPGDFDGWRQEGCLLDGYALRKLEVSDEGLLVQTPDEVHTESRVYFWSPRRFEGDLAVQYDFRPESETGLALLVAQASGMQGEDFLDDHPERKTGAMDTIISDRVRNYHWEYFRKAVDVRGDLGTHILVKNPWFRPLGMSTTEPLKLGEWHRLLFLQEGDRIRAAIDGEWVLDVRDSANEHSGPVLRSGRIGLRLMYGTRMSFRDLTVWNRS